MAEAGGIDKRLVEKLHIEREWMERYPSELSGGNCRDSALQELSARD